MHEHGALCNGTDLALQNPSIPFRLNQSFSFPRCGLGPAGHLLSEGRQWRERLERDLQFTGSARPSYLQQEEVHLYGLWTGKMETAHGSVLVNTPECVRVTLRQKCVNGRQTNEACQHSLLFCGVRSEAASISANHGALRCEPFNGVKVQIWH